MGYGKAMFAAGIMMLIVAMLMGAGNSSSGGVGAIGVLLMGAGVIVGLFMTAADPFLTGKKDKMAERQARDIEELNEVIRRQDRQLAQTKKEEQTARDVEELNEIIRRQDSQLAQTKKEEQT